MSELIGIITAAEPEVRNRSLDAFCRAASVAALLDEACALDRFRRESVNLYERVRAQFFLYSIHRFHLSTRAEVPAGRPVPLGALEHILNRRFNEAIDSLLGRQSSEGVSAATSSALAAAYHSLAFQTLAAQ